MTIAMDKLASASASENYTEMQVAVRELREALAQFDSGLAVRRALAEGRAPRNVALQWFKKELNLVPLADEANRHVLGGASFHLVVIAILGTFAASMIAMYFFKMRRATALVKELSKTVPEGRSSSKVVDSFARDSGQSPLVAAPPQSAPVAPPQFPEMKNRTEPVHKWSGKLRVCRILDECPGVKTFRLADLNDIGLPFTFYPGQFLTLSMTVEGKTVRRSYTIASSPTQSHYCGLTVKRESNGLVSRYLHDRGLVAKAYSNRTCGGSE